MGWTADSGFELTRKHGYEVAEVVNATADGRVSIFVAFGGRFLPAVPDTGQTPAARQRTNRNVQVSTKLNRSHLMTGKHPLILPTHARTEEDPPQAGLQPVTDEDSISAVQHLVDDCGGIGASALGGSHRRRYRGGNDCPDQRH